MPALAEPIVKTAPTILNVDDYPPGRYTRSKILKQAGFTVYEATSGTEALNALAHRPDLVLLDVNLPDINGVEVCRRIKGNPDTAGIVVLHLSASNLLPSDQVLGLNSGADGYLTEPVEPAVLIATMNALLRIRKAEEALRYSNEALRNVTDMLSHELREPIRAVTIYGQLLHQNLGSRLTPEEENLFQQMLSGSRRMDRLVEGVLVYSRAIYEIPTLTRVSVQEALDTSLAELELLIAEAGGQVTVEGTLPFVQGDKLSLVRVFSNLISNSIKYRSSAPPRIRISAATEGNTVRISVEDNGIGIDPQYHSKIFDVFSRLHGVEYSGAGVGLSLCRRIVERMGGSIWVDSEEGHGARFTFTLTREPDQPSA
jgi:two-component system, sensor histidine kinase and response regulator